MVTFCPGTPQGLLFLINKLFWNFRTCPFWRNCTFAHIWSLRRLSGGFLSRFSVYLVREDTWRVSGWYMNGTWMVREWEVDGMWMVCGWYMNGTWMVRGWYTDSIPKRKKVSHENHSNNVFIDNTWSLCSGKVPTLIWKKQKVKT